MIESYLTITSSYGPIEFKEKGSRFISYLFSVNTAQQAEDEIARLWKQYHDATHICYAWRVGSGIEDQFRYNDDGEPNGTAGLPIYRELQSSNIFNILCASVRYYGGTKLGTGGLTRAYSQSAKLVLTEVSPQTIYLKDRFNISISFDFLGTIMYIINNHEGTDIIEQNYTESGVTFILDIPVGKVESFAKLLKEKSAGKVVLF